MKKNKVVRILRTLSTEEFKRFHEFAKAPYFNKNKKCIELIDLLAPFSPSFDDDKLDEPGFLDPVYTKKNSIKTVLQVALKLLEDFLAIEELKQQDAYKNYLVLKQLWARKETLHFLMVYKRTVQDFNKKSEKTLLGFYQQFLIATEYLQYQFASPTTEDPKYHELLDHLDTAYLANRLKYASGLANLQRIKTGERNIPAENAMLQLAGEDRLANNTVVILYKTAYLLIVENKEQYFHELKALLKQHLAILPKEEADALYTATMNFCIRKLSAGLSNYYNHLFEIYKDCIEQEIFMVNGNLSPQRLQNIVIVGTKAGHFTWMEDFLDNSKSYLDKDFRDIIYYYCKGYLYNSQKQYDKASSFLLQANAQGTPKNTSQYSVVKLIKFNIQVLLLKIYYEEEEVLPFFSLVKSFNERLRETKDINKQEIASYLNFTSTANWLFRYKTEPNFKKPLFRIQEKMSNLKQLNDKQWLLAKLSELSA